MKTKLCICLFTCLLALQSCGGGSIAVDTTVDTSKLVQSPLTRNTAPRLFSEDTEALIQSNTAFAVDFYGIMRKELVNKNMLISPYSVSYSMVSAYPGTRGTTATQIANVMHFTLSDARLYASFNGLDLALDTARNNSQESNAPSLYLANSLWCDSAVGLVNSFLDALAVQYGTGIYTVPTTMYSALSTSVNQWVANNTENTILDFVPASALPSGSYILVVNADYLKGAFRSAFTPVQTESVFHGIEGDTAAAMMMQTNLIAYGTGPGWSAATLPLNGNLSFTAILPDNLESFESAFDLGTLKLIDASLSTVPLTVTMPSFEMKAPTASLKNAMVQLGAESLFNQSKANFSSIGALPRPVEAYATNLYLKDILQQASLSLDLTSGSMPELDAQQQSQLEQPPLTFTLDKPYIFLVRDTVTGTILFMGRYVSS
jgi:serpin B